MNHKSIEILLIVGSIMFPIIVPGCGQKSYEKQQYILDAQRASQASDAKNPDSIIEVRGFTIDPAFSTKKLTYRTGDFEYETDFYNEFLISPAAMITGKVRNWLSESGLFQRVLDPASYIDPYYVMEGNIVALYGDFRDKSSPKAVMEIRIFLLKTKAGAEPLIVFGKTYKSNVALESAGPESLIMAFDHCLTEILTTLEKDLKDKLS